MAVSARGGLWAIHKWRQNVVCWGGRGNCGKMFMSSKMFANNWWSYKQRNIFWKKLKSVAGFGRRGVSTSVRNIDMKGSKSRWRQLWTAPILEVCFLHSIWLPCIYSNLAFTSTCVWVYASSGFVFGMQKKFFLEIGNWKLKWLRSKTAFKIAKKTSCFVLESLF